jgi:hypothetical protein
MESRTIDASFFGVGLPHLRVEALIVMTTKLLMHHGFKTATGKFVQTSYLLFFAEVGLVVPMEITFMNNGGNIFVLCEFIDYMNSYII